jgi:hypothetical protein
MPISDDNFLRRYLNPWFVETGSFQGDTIQKAIDVGFENIRSVELNFKNFELCYNRFKNNLNVKLYYGESEEFLWKMIEDINQPITFFLDSHYSGSGEGYVTSKGKTFSSIVSELETIMKHPLNIHTILIDDIRDCGTQNFDFITKRMLIEYLFQINPDYKIFHDTGDYTNPLFKGDILIARV